MKSSDKLLWALVAVVVQSLSLLFLVSFLGRVGFKISPRAAMWIFALVNAFVGGMSVWGYVQIRRTSESRERAGRTGLMFIGLGLVWLVSSVVIVYSATQSMLLGLFAIGGFFAWLPLVAIGAALGIAAEESPNGSQ